MRINWRKVRFSCVLAVVLASTGILIRESLPTNMTGDWQSAGDIRALLTVNGAGLTGLYDGKEWSETFSDDGTITGVWGARKYEGEWSFNGDMICLDYEGIQFDGCWYIAIKLHKVQWWKPDGARVSHMNAEYFSPDLR